MYLRIQYLDPSRHLIIQSILDRRLKDWSLDAGFRIVPFEFFGPGFLHYYCDCDNGRFKKECLFRNRECLLMALFPGDPFTPPFRPDMKMLLNQGDSAM